MSTKQTKLFVIIFIVSLILHYLIFGDNGAWGFLAYFIMSVFYAALVAGITYQ